MNFVYFFVSRLRFLGILVLGGLYGNRNGFSNSSICGIVYGFDDSTKSTQEKKEPEDRLFTLVCTSVFNNNFK